MRRDEGTKLTAQEALEQCFWWIQCVVHQVQYPGTNKKADGECDTKIDMCCVGGNLIIYNTGG